MSTAKLLAQHDRFQWMDGMLAVNPSTGVKTRVMGNDSFESLIPDLKDPATIGCLINQLDKVSGALILSKDEIDDTWDLDYGATHCDYSYMEGKDLGELIAKALLNLFLDVQASPKG